MNRLYRTILRPLPWFLKWYLSKEREYRYEDLSIVVMPGVFHPGLFHSTTMLLQYIDTQLLTGSFLEVGGGTGIVSILAARKGVDVVVTDISKKAVDNIHQNATKNSVSITIIQSDLFENMVEKKFDWIVVNPPYYPRKPDKEEDYAWYCGEQHEYFLKFFQGVNRFIKPESHIIMVLSEVCDLSTIYKIASGYGFTFVKIAEKSVWVDGKNYVFQIKQTA